MAFTGLATRVYKDPITTVYLNSIKQNDDALFTSVAKAWVNFDGSAAASSARSSNNVTSITKNGTGDWTITWAINFTAVNYVVFGSIDSSGSDTDGWLKAKTMNTSTTRVLARAVGSLVDASHVMVGVIGAF